MYNIWIVVFLPDLTACMPRQEQPLIHHVNTTCTFSIEHHESVEGIQNRAHIHSTLHCACSLQGILTTDLSSSMQKTSTVEETFKSPEGPRVRMTGSRREALQKALYEMVSKEVENEFHPPPPPAELVSTTKHDFSRGKLVHN